MSNKIAIIGAGLFGITTYLLLKKEGYDCTLFEKKSKILDGASTNNLNRVHFGYHYPRDNETAKQSTKGYKSFKKFYSTAVINNFDNYYFIANSSKVDFDKYLQFCKKNKLNFRKINLKNFILKNKNLQGGIKVKEPIYDWQKIRESISKKLKLIKKNDIKLNEEIISILPNKKFILKTNKKNYKYDIIIDASYEGSNKISNKISKQKKFIYQQVIVYEFILKNYKKMGLALMDGKFFSFLPKGDSNKHILYHVKYSVLKNKISYQFPSTWQSELIKDKQIISSKQKTLDHLKYYFPDLDIRLTKKNFISPRVFPINQEKTDKRVSKIIKLRKNYYKILSSKVDHCVDIAHEIIQSLKTYK